MREIVNFKSIPKIFEKEKSDIKNNTVRELEKGNYRFEILNQFALGIVTDLTIEIENTETGYTFQKQVKDVTIWRLENGKIIYIITWEIKKDWSDDNE